MNVVKLKTTKSVIAKKPSIAHKRRVARMKFAAGTIAAVALPLTGPSRSQLADGVQALTQSSTWHAWAMAWGIDLGFIGLEPGQLTLTTDSRRRFVARYANPAIIGTLVASAIM